MSSVYFLLDKEKLQILLSISRVYYNFDVDIGRLQLRVVPIAVQSLLPDVPRRCSTAFGGVKPAYCNSVPIKSIRSNSLSIHR